MSKVDIEKGLIKPLYLAVANDCDIERLSSELSENYNKLRPKLSGKDITTLQSLFDKHKAGLGNIHVRTTFEAVQGWMGKEGPFTIFEDLDSVVKREFQVYLAYVVNQEIRYRIKAGLRAMALKVAQWDYINSVNDKRGKQIYKSPEDAYLNYPHDVASALCGLYSSGSDSHTAPTVMDANNFDKVVAAACLRPYYGPEYSDKHRELPMSRSGLLGYISNELLPKLRRRQLLAPQGVVIGAKDD